MTKPNRRRQEKGGSWKPRHKRSVRSPDTGSEPNDDFDLKPGDHVGSIRVLAKLDSGLGLVFAGIMAGGCAVALKTFRGAAKSKRLSEEFLREGTVWAGLGPHPHVVCLLSMYKWKSKPFLVSEFIAPDDKGRNTLEHYLAETVSLRQALQWAIEFCQGMEYAVAHGVECHGDIKPANIMIAPDRMLKITDFGLANFWRSDTTLAALEASTQRSGFKMSIMTSHAERKIAGTPAYMAPEQFDGSGNIRSDIYSFGLVLYQMQNHGEHPFGKRQGIEAWNDAHRNEIVPELGSPLFPPIKKCVEKKPMDRYQNFGQIRTDLAKIWVQCFPRIPVPPSGKVLPPSVVEFSRQVHLGMVLRLFGEDTESKSAFSAAEGICLRACEVSPINPELWHRLGAVCGLQRKFSKAEKAYQRSCDLDPNHPNRLLKNPLRSVDTSDPRLGKS